MTFVGPASASSASLRRTTGHRLIAPECAGKCFEEDVKTLILEVVKTFGEVKPSPARQVLCFPDEGSRCHYFHRLHSAFSHQSRL